MKHLTTLLALMYAVTVTIECSAQQPNQQREQRRPGQGARTQGDGQSRGGPTLLMQALDADGDGTISKTEIANAVAALKNLDKNNDGMLSREEQGRNRGPGQQTRGRTGGQPSGRPDRNGGGGDLVARVMESDKNKDGKISKDEAPDRMKQGFDRIDANSDGFIDRKELEALAARVGDGQGRPSQGRPGSDTENAGGAKPKRPGFE